MIRMGLKFYGGLSHGKAETRSMYLRRQREKKYKKRVVISDDTFLLDGVS